MLFNRIVNLALSAALIFAVAGSIGPGWCGEAATQEQNLALLKRIEADLAKKPGDVTFQLQHAAIMGRLKRYEEQVAEASSLIRKDPKLREAYLILSDGQANQQRYAEALVSLDMAFKLGPPTPMLLLQKARYLRNEKRYDAAIETVNKVIAAEPSNVDAYKCRSACYFRLKGPCEEALRDMDKVVLLNPLDAAAKSLVEDLKRELKTKGSSSASPAK